MTERLKKIAARADLRPTREEEVWYILGWLRSRWDGWNGFWGNRNLFFKAHENSELFVRTEPEDYDDLIDHDEWPIAVLMVSDRYDTVTLDIVEVVRSEWRKGIAYSMLKPFVEAMDAGEIEALEADAATDEGLALLHKLGFTKIERRDKYEYLPKDDQA
ncbi:hypothetical protein FIV42_26355 [Persicimonas caeni]|uniref:N-acetyltransferase domain-containing protein n=1 Tax=Persicimonas caeni TaxID=2292766 RepID=A0A4Y6Q0M9_PERCE|nr:hypothetical protein [Persicimonas caeni]QDG54136.1 hypothetical protein FIV42_26355 [Persicimonas caeni]QED35357.1 hypothetical protein FRD00_26350 [Persicimonas caeni]